MRLVIFGKDIKKTEEFKKYLKEFNFEYSEKNPDLVICYGGDGTFLIAERVYPGVPKIFLKGSEIANKGHDINIKEALQLYLKKKYSVEEIKKLRATYMGVFETRMLLGVNDIVIRNSLPTEALRFKIADNNFIGDGIVVATAFGSGGYFSSITGKEFNQGVKLAFNNVKGNQNSILVEGGIEIEILRGPGVLVADNNRDYINLEKGDKILIEETTEVAQRIILDED